MLLEGEGGAGIPTDDEILSQHAAGQPAAQPAPVADPGAAPGGAPSVPSFNPADWAYKFRDTTVTPKDRDEVIQLMQFGRSYRENKPKWEPILQGWETRKDEYRKYDQLSEALKQNPTFRTELEQLAQKYSGQPTPPAQDPQAPGLPPEVTKRLEAFEQWKQEVEAEKADGELKRELDAIEASEPTYDWKSDHGEGNLRTRLIKYMHEKQVYSPEIAFAAMMRKEDLARVQMETRKKAEEDAAKARKAGVTVPGTQHAPAPTPTSLDHRKLSYDDLENAALASVGRP